MPELTESQVYDRIGEAGFARLVRAFYAQVPADPILGPMYPPADMEGAASRLKLFLMQRFGGPDAYTLQRGHPRLRMRHAPFEVNINARDRWMALMTHALDQCGFDDPVRNLLFRYFADTATFMINR